MPHTQSSFFGGGKAFSGTAAGGFSRNARVYYLGPTAVTLNTFGVPKASLRPVLKNGEYIYVVNDTPNTVTVKSGASSHGTIAAGYTGRVVLVDNSTTDGVYQVSSWQHNNAGRTHGITTRPDGITATITANSRATITHDVCDVWILSDCEGVAEPIYSRQDWTAYNGQAVNLSFEDANLYRVVSAASTITKPIDTRDLLSLVNATIAGGCVDFSLIYGQGSSSPEDNILAIDVSDGTLNGASSHISSNDFDAGNSSPGSSYDGDYLLVSKSGSTNTLYLHNVLSGTTSSIVLGTDESIFSLGNFGYRVNSSGDVYVLLDYEFDTVNVYSTPKLRKYNSSGVQQWEYDMPSDDATYPSRCSMQGISRVADNKIALIYLDNSTLDSEVRILNATTGAVLYSWTVLASVGIGSDILQPHLNTEGGVTYFYCFQIDNGGVSRTFEGASGAAKINKYDLAGNHVWEYDCSHCFSPCVNALGVWVGHDRGGTHDGGAGNASVLRLSVAGVLQAELDGGASFPLGQYLDVNRNTGAAIANSSSNNGPTFFSTSALVWSDSNPTSTWSLSSVFHDYPMMFKEGSC